MVAPALPLLASTLALPAAMIVGIAAAEEEEEGIGRIVMAPSVLTTRARFVKALSALYLQLILCSSTIPGIHVTPEVEMESIGEMTEIDTAEGAAGTIG